MERERVGEKYEGTGVPYIAAKKDTIPRTAMPSTNCTDRAKMSHLPGHPERFMMGGGLFARSRSKDYSGTTKKKGRMKTSHPQSTRDPPRDQPRTLHWVIDVVKI